MTDQALAPFLWGAGGSKNSFADRRKMAEAMLKSGMDYSPVQHWTQGLARLAQALVGGYEAGQADKQEKANNEALASALSGALGASGSSAPASAPTATKSTSSLPSFAGGKTAMVMPEIKDGIKATAASLGISPIDLATAISYETGGTFDPTKAGPTTQYGQHRGLIQFGEPQARQFGVDWNNPVGSQLGPNGAVAAYLRNAGVQPGMGMMDIYSAINAGRVGRYGASDAANGGAPGTVADKVNQQMAGHRAKAMALFGEADLPAHGASPVAMETGQNGFFIPGDDPAKLRADAQYYAQTNPEASRQLLARANAAEAAAAGASSPAPAMTGDTFNAITAGLGQGTPAAAPPPAMTGATFDAITSGNKPLDPVFQTEGISQPWMGTAITPAAPAGPQMVQAPLPPSRPTDIAMPEADLPAPGAVPAIGQMPVAPQPDLAYANDAGMRQLQVASEEARQGQPSGGAAPSPFASIAQALTGSAAAPVSAVPAAASPAVQSVAQAVAPQAGPGASPPSASPLGALAVALIRSGNTDAGVKLASSLLAPVNGIKMDDRLVDPRTGRVIADFTGANGGRSNEFGLNPVYGTDKDGKTVIMQIGKRGDAVVTKLPEGVSLASGVERVDLGTSWGLMDKRTGQLVGTLPKDVAGAEKAKVEGKTAGERVAEAPQAELTYKSAVGTLDRLASEAKALRDHPGLKGITGWQSLFPNAAGGQAANAQAKLETLKSQIGFGVLQAMREASKTGGALGSVSDAEGKRLENNLAALAQSQSLEEFQKNLDQIIGYAETSKGRLGEAYRQTYPNAPAARPAPPPPTGQTKSGVKWSVE